MTRCSTYCRAQRLCLSSGPGNELNKPRTSEQNKIRKEWGKKSSQNSKTFRPQACIPLVICPILHQSISGQRLK